MNKPSIEISLEHVKHILRILHTYPKEMELLGFKDLVNPKELHSVHMAWCDLYSKYDGNEKAHFSTSWFPFLFSGYDFFIDLTTSEYTIFESTVNPTDNSDYICLEYFESVNELLLLLDTGYDMKRYTENYKEFKMSVLYSFFPEEE